LARGEFAVEIDLRGLLMSTASVGNQGKADKKKRNPFQHTFLHEGAFEQW